MKNRKGIKSYSHKLLPVGIDTKCSILQIWKCAILSNKYFCFHYFRST